MKRYLLFLFILVGCMLLASGCSIWQAPTSTIPVRWQSTDLRLLDLADGENADGDLIAAYARRAGKQIQVRLDLLDSQVIPQHDLYLAIDSQAGGITSLPGGNTAGIAWEWLVYLPAQGEIQVLESSSQGIARQSILAIRNTDLDTVEISLQAYELNSPPGGLRFQAFTRQPGDARLSDSTEVFSLAGAPPPPARTLLAFWNTLPAYSPAQALRRWDGAHTGPLGARHGLGNLLKALRDYRAPAALLDLKNIASLAALDYIDQVDTVTALAERGLLILPENMPELHSGPADDLPAELFSAAAATSRQVASELGLPAAQFAYGSLSRDSGARYRFLFLPQGGIQEPRNAGLSAEIFRYASLAVLPVPTGITTTQATLQGPTLELRRALVNEALRTSENANGISLLGGDLSHSTWGDPQHAAATLRWLKAHPWIALLDAHDLLSARPSEPLPDRLVTHGSQRLPETMADELVWASASAQPLAANAWQAFLASYAPVSPGSQLLPALRRTYLGYVNILLKAARWAENPQPVSACEGDIDQDGTVECTLANESQMAVFNSESGTLVAAFVLRDGAVHQWIASSAQFISGQSDAALWQLELGQAADPSIIPGAFSDQGPFQAEVTPGSLTFISPELAKTFTLTENGMLVRYNSQKPVAVRIPLAVDPWLRFQADWEERYAGARENETVIWGAPESFQVALSSDATMDAQDFTASRNAGQAPENPNRDYPAGHYVLFPLALVEVRAPAGFTLQVRFLPPRTLPGMQ